MISFIIAIKNRTKIRILLKDRAEITLELFKNNLQSLMQIHQDGEVWEFVVVDFTSKDVDMPSFLSQTIAKNGCSHKHLVVEGPFSKGKGLNIGFTHASHETLFFLDADMMIKTRKLFEDIEECVNKKNNAMFPICYSYKNPEHSDGWVRHSGMGNAIYKKSDFVPYFENKIWGHEDVYNFRAINQKKTVLRPYYNDGFVHQWHPQSPHFKNRYYKN